LCAIPLRHPRKLCQERDAEKVPRMKRVMLIGELAAVILSPKMRDVKYVMVTGFKSVSPRIMPYAFQQPIDANLEGFSD